MLWRDGLSVSVGDVWAVFMREMGVVVAAPFSLGRAHADCQLSQTGHLARIPVHSEHEVSIRGSQFP